MNNDDLAAVFDELADLLEIQGANPFRVRAYRNGARSLRDHAGSVASLAREGAKRLEQIDGIGTEIAAKILTLVETGSLPHLVALKQEIPASVLTMLRVPGLGPKKAAALHRELGISTLEQLRAACDSHAVRALKGFGAKTEELILAGLAVAESGGHRMLWAQADRIVQDLVAALATAPGVERLEPAGSYRRGKESVGDLDFLVVARDHGPVMDRLATHRGTTEILVRGETKLSVRTSLGIQVDLRVVPAESFGAALQYFTGSKDHNVVLRQRAKDRGLKLNEWGLFRGDERVAGPDEAGVYAALDLPWIPPELREARREFEWADAGRLPELLELSDLQGDLHMHTTETDGAATLEQMVAAARALGRRYIAITDHSQRVAMARGMDGERLRRQWAEIDALNARLDDFRVLKGVEVDILEAGGLDLPDDVLAEADWVVASIHYGQRQPREQIMRRVFDALENPYVTALAHPTGRIINHRVSYDVDVPAMIAGAAKHGKLLELNASPSRLDLDDVHCAIARDHGVPIVISTDAHNIPDLGALRYGVLQARRAGLTRHHVANTLDWPSLAALLKKNA